MLIIKQILVYMLLYPYSEENEKFLHELYFGIWGKGKTAETLIELWKKGYFDIDVIPVDWIEDRIADIAENEDMNIEEAEVLEKLLKDWEKTNAL